MEFKFSFNAHKFSIEITETTTTSTTSSFKIGGSISEKVSVEGKIPFIGSAKSETTITVTGEYSWSSSVSNSVQKKVTFEMPSQEITLNPNDKYEITALLYTGTINGKTLLKMPVTGRVHFDYSAYYNYVSPSNYVLRKELTLAQFITEYGCPSFMVDKNNKDAAYILGKGTISVPYAIKTELSLKRSDANDIEKVIEVPLLVK